MAPSPRKRRRLDSPGESARDSPPTRSPRRKASVNMQLDDATPARRLRPHTRRGSSTSSTASTSTTTRRRGPQRRASAPTSTEDDETDAGERRQRAARIGKTPTRERVPLSPVKADRPLPRTPRARAGARPRTRSFEVMHDSPPQMRKRKRLSTSDESSSDDEPDEGSMDLDARTPVPRRTRSGALHLRDRVGPPRYDSRTASERSSLSPDENRVGAFTGSPSRLTTQMTTRSTCNERPRGSCVDCARTSLSSCSSNRRRSARPQATTGRARMAWRSTSSKT